MSVQGFDLGKFKSNLRNVIVNDIWSINPITDASNYINSLPMQKRTIMHAHSLKDSSSMEAVERVFDKGLCFPKRHFIGPYEDFIFNKLIESDSKFFIFSGGARTGKSSILNFLRQLMKESLRDCNKTTDPIYQHCSNIILIDLLDTSTYYRERMTVSGDNPILGEELTRSVLKDLTRMVQSVFFEYLQSIGDKREKELFCESFKKAIIGSSKGDNSAIDFVTDVITRLKIKIDWNSWDKSNTQEKLSQIEVAVEKLVDPESTLVASFLPIWTYCGEHLQGSRKLFIVLDNIDPMPLKAQTRIALVFHRMLQSKYWQGVKVILPARLGTLRDELRSFEDNTKVIPHQSTEPSYLCFHKLIKFFMDRNSNEKFMSINNTQIRNAICNRLFSFWFHLVDEKSYFQDIFNAMAGTNHAVARNIMLEWCLSDLVPIGDSDVNVLIDNKDVTGCSIVDATLNEVWELTVNAFRYSLNSFSLADTSTEESNKQTDLFVASFYKLIIDIYVDSRILCRFDKKLTSGYQDECLFKESHYFQEMLPERINDWISSYDPAAESSIVSNQARDIMNAHELMNCDFAGKLSGKLLGFLEGNTSRFSLLIDECCRGHMLKVNKEVSVSISKWLSLVFSHLQRLPEKKGLLFHQKRFKQIFTASLKGLPHINRFKAGAMLLDAAQRDSSKLPITPINVFASTFNKASTACLNILYSLRYRKDISDNNYTFKMRNGELEDLIVNKLGYDKTEFDYAIALLMSLESKLIFSNSSHLAGYRFPVEGPAELLFLSSAGKSYVDKLVMTPPYIEWALSRVTDLYKGEKPGIINQICSTLAGLKLVVELDLRKIRKFNNILIDTEGNDAQEIINQIMTEKKSAAADLYFRVLPTYISSLETCHYMHRGGGKHKDEELLFGSIKDWIKFGTHIIEETSNVFGKKVTEWEENILYAQYCLDKIAM